MLLYMLTSHHWVLSAGLVETSRPLALAMAMPPPSPASVSVFTVIEGEVFRIIDGVVGAEAMLLWN
jgi:hypothetical protein